ncbi:PRC-barrel domain-containing protein [Leptospira interrogans]
MKPMSVAILSILTISSAAVAQAQTTTPPATSPPAVTTADNQFAYYTQQQGDFRARSLIGATVRNTADESIGEIDDLVLSPDGQIVAAVVGVGGFLGIGEHHVAVTFSSRNIERDSSALTQRGSFIVRVNATKESLQNAPQWKDPTTAAR